MDDIDAFLDQPTGEADLLLGDVIAPVAAPVDRGDQHVAGAAGAHLRVPVHLTGNAPSRLFREVRQQVDAGPLCGYRFCCVGEILCLLASQEDAKRSCLMIKQAGGIQDQRT
jgi:hypothetical protein